MEEEWYHLYLRRKFKRDNWSNITLPNIKLFALRKKQNVFCFPNPENLFCPHYDSRVEFHCSGKNHTSEPYIWHDETTGKLNGRGAGVHFVSYSVNMIILVVSLSFLACREMKRFKASTGGAVTAQLRLQLHNIRHRRTIASGGSFLMRKKPRHLQ